MTPTNCWVRTNSSLSLAVGVRWLRLGPTVIAGSIVFYGLTVGLLSSTPRRLSLEASLLILQVLATLRAAHNHHVELDYVGATLDQESVGRPIETLNASARKQ